MISTTRSVSTLPFGSLAVFAIFCGFPIAPGLEAQESKPRLRSEVGAIVLETEIITRTAVCKWAKEPPVLDGKLDDGCWQRAAVIERFGFYWTSPKTPPKGMFAYLVWDDDALYY